MPKAAPPPTPKRRYHIGPWEDFKQQRCYECVAITRPFPLGFIFCWLAALCILLGVLFTVSASYATKTRTYRYDNLCEMNTRCTFRFEIEDDLDAPVYLYYRLENYYQAHRRYLRSRSDSQLLGNNVNDYGKLGSCDPKISEDDEEDESSIYLPCGLIAWSFFNDTYTLLRDNGSRVGQSSRDIALPHDDRVFDDPGPETAGIRIVNSFENPHLMVWMRAGALTNFNKLYAEIDNDLPAGIYRMEIENNYPVSEFDGEKYFFLTTTTWIGGRNFVTGSALLIVGACMFIVGFFVCLKACIWPRKLGNIAYLEWD